MQTNELQGERPEWLDFLAFRLVMVEQKSLAATAQALNLDTIRVGQLVRGVDRFLLAQAPGADDEEQRHRQLHQSRQLAAERLDYLHHLAIRAYHESARVKVRLRKASAEEGEPKVDRQVIPGQPRYLLAAARIAQMAVKLPLPRLHSVAVETCFGDERFDLSSEPVGAEKQVENPPDGDCSPAEEAAAGFAAGEDQIAAVNAEPAVGSIAGVDPAVIAKMARTRTVHHAEPEGAAPPTRQGRRDAFFREK